MKAMLDVGKERALGMNLSDDLLSWLCADAQQLPLNDNSFDLYTIAFGIRNVVDVQKVYFSIVNHCFYFKFRCDF